MPAIDSILVAALAVSLLAGFVRGFSGFGGALIFVPLISALYDPARAGPTLLIVDVLLTLPLTIRSAGRCDWREIAPMAIAGGLFTPVGVWAMTTSDPVALRWAICGAVAVILALLVSGLRYAARPPLGATVAVGAVSGVLGGAAQLSGAPVAAFWLGGPGERAKIRSNLIVFFALVSIVSGLSFWKAGLFTGDVGRLSLWLGPAYGLGILLGARWFVGASDVTYRRAAYAVIAFAAIASAPLFDGLWR